LNVTPIHLALLSLSFVIALGCGNSGGAAPTKQASHVRKLTSLHTMVSLKLRRPPRDEQEFKQTLASMQVSPDKYDVASIDELFVSERDGQPLIVAYGTPSKDSDVVVYEQKGVDGRRLIGHKIGKIDEVDDAEFTSLGIAKN
jgi:hypothetical protein